MSLGELQGFLPRITNSPNPNQWSPRPSCLPQLAGGKKGKGGCQSPPGHHFQGLLGWAGSGELQQHLEHLSSGASLASITQQKCSDLAGRQASGEEPLFCFLLPKITFQSHFISEHPELHPSISHRPSSRQATMTGRPGQHFETQQGATWR